MPLGVTHVLLSFSDTTKSSSQSRPTNTDIRRKSLSSHTLIGEVTRATSDALADHLQDMADASRYVEESKIVVQEQLFNEQMQF